MDSYDKRLTITFFAIVLAFFFGDLMTLLRRIRREKGLANAHRTDGMLVYNVFASTFQVGSQTLLGGASGRTQADKRTVLSYDKDAC